MSASSTGISTEDLLTIGGGGEVFINIVKSNLDGETISWHINDKSLELGQPYVQYMTNTINRLDKIIGLDFELASDDLNSYINVNLYDYSGEDYAGLCYTDYDNRSSRIGIDVIDYSSQGLSSDFDKNTFIHELGHALGLAEPGYDNRWDQDDTAMSYNEGDIGWQSWYTESDLNALIYVWGVENDDPDTEPPDLNNDGFVDDITNYQMWTDSGGVDLTNRGGRRRFSDSTSRMWNAEKAVQVDSGFSLLIKHERKDGKYKVWSSNSDGIITSMSKWKSSHQMMSEGYEDLYELDLNGDSIIGKPPIQDQDGDGFVDGASNYQVYTTDDRELYLRNKNGRRIFSDNTSTQWNAVATSTSPPGSGDTSIYTLVEGEGRKDGKFKIWRSNLVSGNLISQARWKTEQAMVNDGWEFQFNYDINSDGFIEPCC